VQTPVLPAACTDREGRAFSVRPFATGDREPLDRFYDAFDPKRAAQGLPPEGRARLDRWLDRILAGGTHLMVERDGALVGHAMLMPTQRPGVSEYAIFLAKEERGRGVGTAVNRLAAQVARILGLDRLWLSVETHNRPAVRSYEKAGFRFRPGTVNTPEVEMELPL